MPSDERDAVSPGKRRVSKAWGLRRLYKITGKSIDVPDGGFEPHFTPSRLKLIGATSERKQVRELEVRDFLIAKNWAEVPFKKL